MKGAFSRVRERLGRLAGRQSIVRDYLISMAALLLAMLLALQLYHRTTLSSARQTALDTAGFLSGIIFENVSDSLTTLNNTASAIAYSDRVRAFLTETNPGFRYNNDVNAYPFISGMLLENPMIRSVILYDDKGSFYQYGHVYTNAVCRELYTRFAHVTAAGFFVSQVSGSDSFVLAVPIYSGKLAAVERLGLALVLTPPRLMSDQMNAYAGQDGITFLLTDEDGRILVSSDEALTGRSMTDEWLRSLSAGALSRRELPLFGLTAIAAQDASHLMPYTSAFLRTALLLMLAICAAFAVITALANRMILRPLDGVIQAIERIGGGHPQERVPRSASAKVNEMADDLNRLLDSLDAANSEALARQKALYAEQLNRRKHELYMLRRQIDVHFIYNTLSAIASLSEERGQADIRRMADGLGALQRYAFMDSDYINVFAEFQVLEEYVYIMNVRFSGRYHVHYDIDDALCRLRMLRQLLQPLIENAMTHARPQEDGPVRIWLKGRLAGGSVVFTITDDGQGIPPAQLAALRLRMAAPQAEQGAGHGVSLVNIARRLALYYGQGASIAIDSKDGGGAVVTLVIPREDDPDIDNGA